MEKEKELGENGRFWWRKPDEVKCTNPQPKSGDICPHCGEGKLAFDGLFILACTKCQQIADSGGFT